MDVKRIKVFVHLAYGHDAEIWEQRWRDGDLLGFNERFPYGYHHARNKNCEVTFSKSFKESRAALLIRGGLRLLLGFDFLHAYRNRFHIVGADAVWTHTESQHLSVALVLKLFSKKRRPRLIAQSVWLIDQWPTFIFWKRILYRWLIAEADILTFLSPLNKAQAQTIFPNKRCELILFGINTDHSYAVSNLRSGNPINIVSIGNDRHRDWECLISAFSNNEKYTVKIASQKINRKLLEKCGNIIAVNVHNNNDLHNLYKWADIVVVPLRENLHASGITVMQEAALVGRPVVCSRTGGLDAYFTDDEVVFVEPNNPIKLRDAVDEISIDPERKLGFVINAQRRMNSGDLSSRAFVGKHVALTQSLLGSHDVLFDV